jgi:putative transposase
MRPNQSTLKAATVHAYARHLVLQTLELEGYQPALPLQLVASGLLLAACWQTSLTAACHLVRDQPCQRTVREVVYACLPPRPRDLLARIRGALRQTLPGHLADLPRAMALDLPQRPYYGKRNTRGSTRRQKKAGTKNSFTYATLAVLDRCGRFTVGLLPTRPHMRLTTLVGRLLDQAAELDLRVAYLLLDKEFYAAEVIALLQKRQVPFVMPALRRASNRALYDPATPVGWYEYSWTAPLRKTNFKSKKRYQRGQLTVTVRGCVARTPGESKPLVYATWGLRRWTPALVRQRYRRRFGIEAAYRQLGQCLARTSAWGERYRLLLVGVALLLCNLWAYVHSAVFGRGRAGRRPRRLWPLRLTDLLAALAADIAGAHDMVCNYAAGR